MHVELWILFWFYVICMHYLHLFMINRFSSMIWNQRMQASTLSWSPRSQTHWWVLDIIILHWIILRCWKEIVKMKMYGNSFLSIVIFYFDFIRVIWFCSQLDFISRDLPGLIRCRLLGTVNKRHMGFWLLSASCQFWQDWWF